MSFTCRWLYWVDSGTDRIERASMEGASRTVIHNSSLCSPFGLTLDYTNQTLYWMDNCYRRMEKSNVDGSGRTVLTLYGTSISNSYSIAYFNGTLYLSDTTYDRLISTPTESVSVTFFTNVLANNPYGIEVFAAERQPSGM